MSDSAFGPVHWAMSVPPMLRKDGRPDDTAHHVLLVLATFAKRDGTSARPSIATLADKAYKTSKRAVIDALSRIEAAGLISKQADFNGTTMWRLHLELSRIGPTVLDERRDRAREKAAERQRRRREKVAQLVDRHAVPQRDVTPSESVTPTPLVTLSESVTAPNVTPSDSVSHAVGERESRRGTAFVTPSPPSHPQVSEGVTALELPVNCQKNKDSGTSYRADADAPPTHDEPPIVEAEFVDDEPPSSLDAGLFDVDAEPGNATGKKAKNPRAKKPVDPEVTAAQAITATYSERVPLSKFPAVMQIVRKALKAGYDSDVITAALLRLADDNRVVSVDTLRVELEGGPRPRLVQNQRVSTTDQRVAHAQSLKAKFAQRNNVLGLPGAAS